MQWWITKAQEGEMISIAMERDEIYVTPKAEVQELLACCSYQCSG